MFYRQILIFQSHSSIKNIIYKNESITLKIVKKKS